MYDASAERFAHSEAPHLSLAVRRSSALLHGAFFALAFAVAGLWLLFQLFAPAGGGGGFSLAVGRTAGLAVLGGLGFVALLVAEALGGHADRESLED